MTRSVRAAGSEGFSDCFCDDADDSFTEEEDACDEDEALDDGEHRFNRCYKKGEVRPEDEVVTVQVPALVERDTFDAVQKLLQARNPKTGVDPIKMH
ncbi:hypothetical protein [Bosea sp. (in: a-proteobacteria)]